MMIKAAAVLAAGAAVLLSSCASAPRSVPLTIELFDSRARVPAPEAVSAALMLPDVPAHDASAPSPGTAETGPAGGAAALVSSPPASSNAPRGVATAADASLAGPLRPMMAASFALAAPVVPAAAAAPPTRKPPAAGSPSARPAKPSTARPTTIPTLPGASSSSAASPAASVSAAAPSAPGSGAASASAAGSAYGPGSGSAPASASAAAPGAAPASTPNPYGRLREIYAREGDTLQIGLDGVGFLFLGLPDAQSEGMSFKTKENRDNRTLFTFQALKMGTYDLDFLQQDNMSGKTSRETVRVHVVSDQDFNTAVSGQQAAPADAADAVGDPQFAQKLATLGSTQAAVAELLKGYRDGNPGLNDQIAALYLSMGSYDAAEKYYSKNIAPPSDYTSRAVVGLMSVAVAQDDQAALVSWLKQFLGVRDPSTEEPLMRAVRMEKAHGEIGMALDLAQEYVTRFPSGTWRDEADFLTAQLLEADSQFRDIARARQLYRTILSDHPESAFADAARQRVLYIDRHFYQVR